MSGSPECVLSPKLSTPNIVSLWTSLRREIFNMVSLRELLLIFMKRDGWCCSLIQRPSLSNQWAFGVGVEGSN